MRLGGYIAVTLRALAIGSDGTCRDVELHGSDSVMRKVGTRRLQGCKACGKAKEDHSDTRCYFSPARAHEWVDSTREEGVYETCAALDAAAHGTEVWLVDPFSRGRAGARLLFEPFSAVRDRIFTTQAIENAEHNMSTKERNMKEHDVGDDEDDEPESKSMKGRVLGSLAEELPDAGWRIAGRKAIDRSVGPALNALVKSKVVTRATANLIADFVSKPLGGGLYGVVLGTVITSHPRAANKPWVARLAREMRVEGWSRIGDLVVDPVLDALEVVFLSQLRDSGVDVNEPKGDR